MSDDLVKRLREPYTQLFAINEELEANINIKADFIDAKINQLAASDQRIEELEAKLTECEARLEKAVAFIEIVEKCGNGPLWDLARATLKEIKGQNDD